MGDIWRLIPEYLLLAGAIIVLFVDVMRLDQRWAARIGALCAVAGISDLTRREVGVLLPLVALTLVVGIYWDSLLRFVDPAAQALVALVGGS